MSRFFNERPELAAEIAALPPSQQNAAMREAMGSVYDPDAIRDRYEEERIHHRDLTSRDIESPRETPAGTGQELPPHEPARLATNSEPDGHCDVCGAPVGKHHLSYCDLRGDV